jgi:hypothetical protein
MIRHTVLLRLRRPVDEQARAALLDGLRAFAADPPYATGPAHIVADLGLRGETPRSSDALLQAEFPDAEAFAAYLADERHQALLRDVLEPLCEGWWSMQAESEALVRLGPDPPRRQRAHGRRRRRAADPGEQELHEEFRPK